MLDYWSSPKIQSYFKTKEPNQLLYNMVLGSKMKPSFNSVLDIGCGYGRNIFPFIGKSNRICAFDSCRIAVEFTVKRYSTIDGLEVREQNLIDFSIVNRVFDFIVCDGVLHQLDFDNFNKSILWLKDLMTPGSMLFLSLFTKDTFPDDCAQISEHEFQNLDGIKMTLLPSDYILRKFVEARIMPFFVKKEIFSLQVGLRSNLTFGACIV